MRFLNRIFKNKSGVWLSLLIILLLGSIFNVAAQRLLLEDVPPADMTELDRKNRSLTPIVPLVNISDATLDDSEKKIEDASDVIVEDFLVQEATDALGSKNEDESLSASDNLVAPLIMTDIKEEPSHVAKSLSEKSSPDSPIKILKTVVAYNKIEAGQMQWVEVYVQNKHKTAQKVVVKLDFTQPNNRSKPIGRKITLLPATAVQNVIFRHRLASKGTGGIYQVNVGVYSLKNKLLHESKQQLEFLVLGDLMSDDPDLIAGLRSLPEESSVTSDPTILFTDFNFIKEHAVVSDVIPAVVSIKNNSSYNINNISVKTYLVSETNHFAPISSPLYQADDLLFAPGERKEFKFNVLLSANIEVGKYLLLGFIEDGNASVEFNQGDNIALSTNKLRVDTIVLDYPPNNALLRLNNPNEFSWHAYQIDKFFMELSVDPDFENPAQIIRLPKNDVIRRNHIKSLLVENTISRLFRGDFSDAPLYWRIVGLDELGLFVYSETRTVFYEYDY